MKILAVLVSVVSAGLIFGVFLVVQAINWQIFAAGGAMGFLLAAPFARWFLFP